MQLCRVISEADCKITNYIPVSFRTSVKLRREQIDLIIKCQVLLQNIKGFLTLINSSDHFLAVALIDE